MTKILKNDWEELLSAEFSKEYYLRLREQLKVEYQKKTVYPQMDNIFNSLHLTPYDDVKAVILGQDPYHGPDQAHGLSFSVQPGVKKPPSLQNIFKELQDDLGCEVPESGSLEGWARQGVLLLNTVLTVRKGEANSHKGIGWEIFTNSVIRTISQREKPVVFILWGKHAAAKKELIDTDKHRVIESPHPSPFSARRGFFGSRPFSKTNVYLEELGMEKITWCLSG
ncbi:uracil-DNA glycosylase [Bacillus lacus]|uniref:Uracil-DNA glycosylase n=1 Tax=Metabacillus lacus TaxID=1983721 RepID=A0A7X2IWK7_9BACI|nr:uracil-DNA glycosylase [Metabacillus lacus]MRX71146.1 uracil-DNA glycosylase [Metabacillus lacus]